MASNLREQTTPSFAIRKRGRRYIGAVRSATKRKTSFVIDTAKVSAAKDILGTKTLTDTVDAALDELVKRRRRLELLGLLSDPGAFELNDPEVMRGAWR
jgi:hypothetical protein